MWQGCISFPETLVWKLVHDIFQYPKRGFVHRLNCLQSEITHIHTVSPLVALDKIRRIIFQACYFEVKKTIKTCLFSAPSDLNSTAIDMLAAWTRELWRKQVQIHSWFYDNMHRISRYKIINYQFKFQRWYLTGFQKPLRRTKLDHS